MLSLTPSILSEGLVDVVVYNSPDLGQKNRGFCFLNFESHNHATVAKHLLSKPGYRIWGCDLRLDWADPIHTVDPVVMSQVTNLFVRNLCSQVHVDTLYNIFRTYGPLQRIKRLKVLTIPFISLLILIFSVYFPLPSC